MFGWFRSRPNFSISFISTNDNSAEHDRRVTELLDHNNKLVNENRAQRVLIKELAHCAIENHNLLIDHSEHTGYCGCELEKRTVVAVLKARGEDVAK